jgi:hypothetical protein
MLLTRRDRSPRALLTLEGPPKLPHTIRLLQCPLFPLSTEPTEGATLGMPPFVAGSRLTHRFRDAMEK